MKWPLRNGGATYLRNVTHTVQTAQTVQYSDSQCTEQQYWHEHRHCRWLGAGLYCIAPRPFTRFVFYFLLPGKLFFLGLYSPAPNHLLILILLLVNCDEHINKWHCYSFIRVSVHNVTLFKSKGVLGVSYFL